MKIRNLVLRFFLFHCLRLGKLFMPIIVWRWAGAAIRKLFESFSRGSMVEQGRIHSKIVVDGWAGAVMQTSDAGSQYHCRQEGRGI